MAADFQNPIVLSSSPAFRSPTGDSGHAKQVPTEDALSTPLIASHHSPAEATRLPSQEASNGHDSHQAAVKPTRRKASKSGKAGTDTQRSRHFTSKAVEASSATEQVVDPAVELGLETAMLRRRSWTPVGDEISTCPEPDGQVEDGTQSTSFKQMLSAFECQPAADGVDAPVTTKPTNVTRKRKVDAAEAPVRKRKTAAERKAAATKKLSEPKTAKAARTTKVPKEPKAPKIPKIPKATRAKTVTDFAIAAYRKATDQGNSPDKVPVTAFFQPIGTQIVPVQGDLAPILEPDTTVAPKGKAAVLQFQFPAPEKAQHKMRDQDFLFGTSSQLARDESPETLRYIQQALVESEEMAFASQTRSPDLNRSPTPTSRLRVAHAPHGTSLSVIPGESNLWSVAARDETQTMFIGSPRARFRPVGRHVSSPVSVKDIARHNVLLDKDGSTMHTAHDNVAEAFTPVPLAAEPLSSPPQARSLHDSGYVDISEVEKEHQPSISDASPPGSGQAATSYDLTGSSPHRPALQSIDYNVPVAATAGRGLAFAPTPPMASPGRASPGSKENALPSTDVVKRPHGRPRKTPADAPNTDSPKKAALKPKAKVVTTPKKREASAAKPKTVTPTKSTKAPATPKRKLKSPSAIPQPSGSWHDIEEISDSEPDLSLPSPKRRTPSAPKQLALSPSPPPAVTSEDPIVGPSKSESHAALFATITKTIRNAPRGTTTSPSWLEKMLLYDPIVLEDLTAWLVAQGVRADGSVSPVTTTTTTAAAAAAEAEAEADNAAKDKAKAKTKAKKSKKKDDSQPEAGDKTSLQPWVVQRWCEANSICCLWKAGLRGGVRARY